MSIAKMNKVSIVGKLDKQEEILNLIMKKGFVELNDLSYLAEQNEFKDTLVKEASNEERMAITKKLEQIEQAISHIKSVKKVKKSLFAQKNDYRELTKDMAKNLYQKVEHINSLAKKIQENKQKKQELETEKKNLLPWENLEVAKENNSFDMILGFVPKKTNIQSIKKDLANTNISLEKISEDKLNQYICILTYKKEAPTDSLNKVLKSYSFVTLQLKPFDGTPKERLEVILQEITNNEKEIQAATKSLMSYDVEDFENLYDYYLMEKTRKEQETNLIKTKHTFLLQGWLPEGKTLPKSEDYVLTIEKPNEDEDYPVLVENSSIVTPFQSITNMYSCPNKNELDPNPIMAFFYILFFGMMLSDAGYGIILTLVCGFIIWKKKYNKKEGSLIKLLALCGISTIIWGFLFGSFFGNLVKITPVIDPLKDVMQLMGLSLLLGIIHIYVGLFLKAISLVKEKKVWSAIFDVGFWYIFLTGIFLCIIPIVAGSIGIWSKIGQYLAISGAIGLVLTQGRAEKNIFKKLFKGVSSLYDVTSYFADVLSYSRLMALCLSTGVIAQVVNLLGEIAGPIPAIFIGILGHGVNIANSALGSYVHTSRLQYVEFFGKFYEGGGSIFHPFERKTKYTKLKEEM